ncbi:MAG TPA: hypothetical protein VIK01_28100 [Polyangiaceae bacterium]
MEQFELLRRRIFIAKAERVDVTQLELEFEFEKTKLKLEALAQKLVGTTAKQAPRPRAVSQTTRARDRPVNLRQRRKPRRKSAET